VPDANGGASVPLLNARLLRSALVDCGPYLAMWAVFATPPALVKGPPTYTLLPLAAMA
jgi:hypothetical protein